MLCENEVEARFFPLEVKLTLAFYSPCSQFSCDCDTARVTLFFPKSPSAILTLIAKKRPHGRGFKDWILGWKMQVRYDLEVAERQSG